MAVVTNIDADHLNTFGDLEGLADAFFEFVQRFDVGYRFIGFICCKSYPRWDFLTCIPLVAYCLYAVSQSALPANSRNRGVIALSPDL